MSRRPVDYLRAMRGWPTGVAVVTAFAHDGTPVGVTVGSLASHSISPPTVTFNLAVESGSLDDVGAVGALVAVHQLGADEAEVALRFAGPPEARFNGHPWAADRPAPELAAGRALLRGVVRGVVRIGDHAVVIVEVVEALVRPGAPLVHHERGFTSVAEVPALALALERAGGA